MKLLTYTAPNGVEIELRLMVGEFKAKVEGQIVFQANMTAADMDTAYISRGIKVAEHSAVSVNSAINSFLLSQGFSTRSFTRKKFGVFQPTKFEKI